jgi:putative cell wall-binding protein
LQRGPSRFRRAVYGAIAGATAFGALSGLAVQSASAATPATNNLYGTDRYQTAGNLNAAAFGAGGVSTVLLADAYPGTPPDGAGGHQSDALAVSGYAGVNKDGLLLTDQTNSVPQNTLTALSNLKVKNIIAVGGSAAVTPAQVAQLTAAGYTVTQPFQGSDRYATMQMVDSAITPAQVGKDPSGNPTAILASGDYAHLVDALAAGGLAYKWKFPVILTPSGSSTLGTQAQQVITQLGIKHLIVVGGSASVPSSQYTPAPSGVTTVDVIAGADRSATARALEQLVIKTYGASTSTVGLATGATYYGNTGTVQNDGADALSGAPFNGTNFEALCLTNGPGPNDAGSAPQCIGDVNPGTVNVETGPANLQSLSTDLAGAGNNSGAGSVSVANPNTTPGGTFSGTVSNPSQVQSLSVSGCGLTNQTVTFNPSTGAFTQAIPSGQPNGSCTLTFTATLTNGNKQTTTVPFTVGPTTQTGQTTRPQLVSAKILTTTTNGNQTGTNPVGTYVQYVFSQNVSTATLNSLGFHAYDFQDGRYNTCTAGSGQGPGGGSCVFVDPSNPNAIDAVFNSAPAGQGNASPAPAAGTGTYTAPATGGSQANLQTTQGAATLTLATVSGLNAISGDGPAVTLANTGANPAGSAPIGSASNATVTAGTTSAPDLTSVAVVGPGATSGTTAVSFTFDKPAFVQQGASGAAATGFDIVYSGGPAATPAAGLVAGSADEEACTGPNVGSTNAGTTTPGGNGTTTITVICPNAANASGTTLTTANIARGVVQQNTVGTQQPSTVVAGNPACNSVGASTNNFCNPLEASQSPHTASVTPYLTAVQLQPSTTSTSNNVLYTFSQAVTAPNAAKFFEYNSNATQVAGTSATLNGNQVLVNFALPGGSLAAAVGGSASVGAVTGANTPLPNSDDSLPAANPNTVSVTPGTVNAPQLTTVHLTSFNNSFGNTVYGAIYTFSQPINGTGAGGTPGNPPTGQMAAGGVTGLKLYDSDGTQLTCTATATGSGQPNAGTLVVGTGSNGLQPTQVACYSYQYTPSGAAPTTPTSSQMTGATLGTADYATVFGTTSNTNVNNPNPEGGVATS